jgi:hypothetical protein
MFWSTRSRRARHDAGDRAGNRPPAAADQRPERLLDVADGPQLTPQIDLWAEELKAAQEALADVASGMHDRFSVAWEGIWLRDRDIDARVAVERALVPARASRAAIVQSALMTDGLREAAEAEAELADLQAELRAVEIALADIDMWLDPGLPAVPSGRRRDDGAANR